MMNSSTHPPIDLDLQQWLLAHNFNPNDLDQRGENGDTALMRATQTGDLEVVQVLIQAGAELNIKNNDGNNALWFACFRDRADIIEQLVSAGIDLNNQNDNGANRPHVCCLSRQN
jgi:ankyrin repeat protein